MLYVWQSIGNKKSCLLITLGVLLLLLKSLLTVGHSLACLQESVSLVSLLTVGHSLAYLNTSVSSVSLLPIYYSLALLQKSASLVGGTFVSNKILSFTVSVGYSISCPLILPAYLLIIDLLSRDNSWIMHLCKVSFK